MNVYVRWVSLVSSVPSQEIGWEECLRSDLYCVVWDVKSLLSISTHRLWHRALHSSSATAQTFLCTFNECNTKEIIKTWLNSEWSAVEHLREWLVQTCVLCWTECSGRHGSLACSSADWSRRRTLCVCAGSDWWGWSEELQHCFCTRETRSANFFLSIFLFILLGNLVVMK